MSENSSKRIYVRGINKKTLKNNIEEHFSQCGEVLQVDFDDNNRKGFCWVEYVNQSSTNDALIKLHQSNLNGTCLDIRSDTKFTKTNYSIEKRVKTSDSNINHKSKHVSVDTVDSGHYTSNGIVVNNVEYPIPQGRYLIKLLRMCHSSSSPEFRPLLDIMTETRHGNKHNKEVTESMAMVDAVYRLGHLTHTDWDHTLNVNVYVVADGKTPYTAAAMALFLPSTWHFASIDPILDFDGSLLGTEYGKRVHLMRALSQDCPVVDYCSEARGDINTKTIYGLNVNCDGKNLEECGAVMDDQVVPVLSSLAGGHSSSASNSSVNIVIACHSHAPLQEFWDRVPFPRYAVVMPCCGKDWSTLSTEPVDQYDDFEVYSPKRRINLYCEKVQKQCMLCVDGEMDEIGGQNSMKMLTYKSN